MTVMLEVTTEEYEQLKASACVLVIYYVNQADEITRAWVEAMGTREECEEAEGYYSGRLFVVPKGLKLESQIIDCVDVAPPNIQEEKSEKTAGQTGSPPL